MLSRQLTSTEKVLIVILTFIILGGSYFFLIHTPITSQRESIVAEKAQLEKNIEDLQKKVTEISQMKAELEKIDSKARAAVEAPDYDNLQKVISMLNTIMPGTYDYSINFQPTVGTAEDSIVRRPIDMTFACKTYQEAYDVISKLHDGPYRCQISNLVVSANLPQNAGNVASVGAGNGTGSEYKPVLSKDNVSVALTITYFETVEPNTVMVTYKNK